MYRIILVVDEHFGCRVLELARTAYVWLVESAENNRWAEEAWRNPQHGDDPLLYGLSTFKREQDEECDCLIIRLIDMIDEHHGEFAHDPEWSVIDVLGASPSNEIREAVIAYGVDRSEAIPGGFRLHRDGHPEELPR
jgi:hypothetical protein